MQVMRGTGKESTENLAPLEVSYHSFGVIEYADLHTHFAKLAVNSSHSAIHCISFLSIPPAESIKQCTNRHLETCFMGFEIPPPLASCLFHCCKQKLS